MNDYVLVSIIILSYNNVHYLTNAINSVLNQDYPALELIISDDGSGKFNKQKVIEYINLNKRINLKRFFVHNNYSNLGTVKNANNAINMANGQYIKIIGADDVLYDNNSIKKVVDFFNKNENPNILFVTTKVMKCDSRLNETKKLVKEGFEKYLTNKDPLYIYRQLCKRNFIPAPGVFFARDFFQRYGLFNEDYKLLEDWPTWLRISREGYGIYFLNIMTVKYRAGVGVVTSVNHLYLEDRNKCFQQEIRPYRQKIGTFNYLISWFSNIIFASRLLRKLYNIAINTFIKLKQ